MSDNTTESSPVRPIDPAIERILEAAMDEDLEGANNSFSSGTSSSNLSFCNDDSLDDPTYEPVDESNIIHPVYYENTLLQPRSVTGTGEPSRKRIRKKIHWKKEILKRKRQFGEQYTNSSGKIIPAKSVKPAACDKSCPYDCVVLFSETKRKDIHGNFWNLNDEEKKIFYAKYVTVSSVKRKRTIAETSRKQNTFQYFFQLGKEQMRVCRSFFLATLCISQRTIYYFFKNNFHADSGVPKPPIRGKHIKKSTNETLLQQVRRHIESFPCMDSHYLRAGTQRQYLEAGLSIKKMYDLYIEATGSRELKYNMYRKIFNTEYNLSFFVPKKDVCDTCSKFKNINDPTENQINEFEKHRNLNEDAKRRKEADKTLALQDKSIALIAYDLENVFSLPKGNTSNFFYKRKFNVYNLTGYCHTNKTTYCSLWYESQSGRTGNDIASALIKILKAILNNNPHITKLILWSDACVPQNRNRITSLALLKFCETTNVVSIAQRFSTPGHSRIQELDAVHSVIDRHLKHVSYHSPISLIRHLKSMQYAKVHLTIMQMQPGDFYNYNQASLGLNFSNLKFTSATEILYSKTDTLTVKYREKYGEMEPENTVSLIVKSNRRAKSKTASTITKLPNPTQLSSPGVLSKEKIKDIVSMFDYMPHEDREFYRVILKLPHQKRN